MNTGGPWEDLRTSVQTYTRDGGHILVGQARPLTEDADFNPGSFHRRRETVKQHTPAPWTLDGVIITKHSTGIIAHVPTPQNGGVFACVPNAHLIAAAPEMFDALGELADAVAGGSELKQLTLAMAKAGKVLAKVGE